MVMLRLMEMPKVYECMEKSTEDIKETIIKNGAIYESEIYSILLKNVSALVSSVHCREV